MSDKDLLRYSDLEAGQEEDVVRWLDSDSRIRFGGEQNLCLGIELRTTRAIIGLITIGYQDETRRQAGINVVVDRKFNHQGYGAEAIASIFVLGFHDLQLHRITASCDSRAHRFRQMLERVGLRSEGEFIQDRWVKGEWVNTVWYAILASEYESRGALSQPRH
jgi:RimJ/RimL family protein N-acetyltransferase